MGTLGWRLAPIYFLSVREFVGGKAVRAVFALGLIPALFALIYRINPDVDRPRRFLDDIVIQVMLPSVLPLATLILATGAFGDEIDDRTLPYLVLKPITRVRISSSSSTLRLCASSMTSAVVSPCSRRSCSRRSSCSSSTAFDAPASALNPNFKASRRTNSSRSSAGLFR